MTMAASGLAKLIEECGELIQVAGKKLAWYDTDELHWDGSDLSTRLIEEMADVEAAIWLVCYRLGLDSDAKDARVEHKVALYAEWDEDPSNNEHGVDEAHRDKS